MGKFRSIFGTKKGNEQSAHTAADFKNAENAIAENKPLIYIAGSAYDELLELVSEDENLGKWFRGLGKFYISPNGLKHLFSTLLSLKQADGTLPAFGSEAFFHFTERFLREECQNYKARNDRERNRFELIRIKD